MQEIRSNKQKPVQQNKKQLDGKPGSRNTEQIPKNALVIDQDIKTFFLNLALLWSFFSSEIFNITLHFVQKRSYMGVLKLCSFKWQSKVEHEHRK